MEILRITNLVQSITREPSVLATRFTGKRFWDEFQKQLSLYDRGDVVLLSFDNILVMDASFADEVFGQIAVMRARKEYEYPYLILADLNETCEENLQMALVTRIEREPNDKPHIRNCVLVIKKGERLELAGKYESHVQETFSVLASRKELSARELADTLKISLNAASTRLKTIADLGLAKRVDLRDAQGKQYIYHPLV